MKNIKSEVYNALAEIMFKTGATKEKMDEAIKWFQIKFYEDEYEEEELSYSRNPLNDIMNEDDDDDIE